MLSKRERVIRTFELEEPDMVPIHSLGFERTGSAYHDFADSDEVEDYVTMLPEVGDITEQRFWNVDIWQGDPFAKKNAVSIPSPPDHPDCDLGLSGKLGKTGIATATGQRYHWYVGPYFTKKEILMEYWDKYGKPTSHLRDETNYSPQIWEKYVKALEPYYYPMATLGSAPHESLFEGMGLGACAYYMRKDPQFIHFVLNEYFQTNVEIIKRLSEAKVEVVFMFDDLGQKGRTIFSHKRFREFLLPGYKRIYQEAKKHGMFIVHHSCGYIDDFMPDLVDAGLNCIQALEPAAGVDLANLKNTLGDRLSFMGGMDSSAVLNFGTPQEVYDDVKKCILAAGKGGGYFAGPSHNIMDVPWENILALRAALEKYRHYPLNY